MSRFSKTFVLSVALLALLGAQVFGLQQGFLCLCSGEAVESATQFCSDEDHGCTHEQDGIPYQHAPKEVKLEASNKTASVPQVQAPALIAILEFDAIKLFLRATLPQAVTRPGLDRDVNPPASLRVAECTVLRI
jgi:hypothetical protein